MYKIQKIKIEVMYTNRIKFDNVTKIGEKRFEWIEILLP